MNGDPKLYELLNQLGIEYQYIEHPEAPTIEIAKQYNVSETCIASIIKRKTYKHID